MRINMKRILFFILLIPSFLMQAQSLDKIWYSDSLGTCLEFDTTRNLMNITCFYSDFDSNWKKRFEYRIKENILIINWYNNQTIFGWTAEKTIWNIEEFSDSTLALRFIKGGYGGTCEIMRGEYIKLHPTHFMNCKKLLDNKNVTVPNRAGD